MAQATYLLCALTAALCAWLLLRAHLRARQRLLFWGGLCFVGLTLNNLLLVLDKLVFPDIDLQFWRSASSLVALLPLLYGLIWEDR